MTVPELSLVVPFFNEEGAAGPLLDEAVAQLDALGKQYEVIAVDDGSRDGTHQVLVSVQSRCPAVRVLRHRQNAGQAAALLTGIRAARGAILITMDGDGQNDPADIGPMLQRLADCDMVVGVRAHRQDSSLRRAMSLVANAIRRRWLRDGVSDTGCALKVFRADVARAFLPIRTLYSFIPALAVAEGFRVTEYPVHHRARETGISKYGLLTMLWRPTVDMLALGWLRHRRIPTVQADETHP